jgi:hypothetical protein
MVLGQLFLVTAVARIVAGWVPRWGFPGLHQQPVGDPDDHHHQEDTR